MPETFDLILKGGQVATPAGIGRADIGVTGGRIRAIGTLGAASAGEVIDATGLHILPGVVDTQVHFREPGMEHKEDLESGSRAAVMGGVTGVFEMPNTNPLTVTAEALADKVRRGTARMHCDFAFYVGGTHDNVADLPELERLPGAAGIKVFIGSSTGSLLVEDDGGVRNILKAISRRAAFHCEDEPRLKERRGLRVPGDASSHPVWRDEIAALTATRRLVTLARETGKRVHVLHITSAEEMASPAAPGGAAWVGGPPHPPPRGGRASPAPLAPRPQRTPPVRDARHREALWAALASGVVDVLGSDHAPHTLAEKELPYPESPSGMTGVQTLVPLMLDHVAAGRLTLERFVDLTSAGPNRLFGMAGKGRIAVGYDADFTVVDLKRQATITNGWIASKAQWTPYDGKTVTGWPVGTFVRGTRVMWEGELTGPSTGAPIRFLEALPPAA